MSQFQNFFLYSIPLKEDSVERLSTLPRNLQAANYVVQGVLDNKVNGRDVRIFTHEMHRETAVDIQRLQNQISIALMLDSVQSRSDEHLGLPGNVVDSLFNHSTYYPVDQSGPAPRAMVAPHVLVIPTPEVFPLLAQQLGHEDPAYHNPKEFMLHSRRALGATDHFEKMNAYRFRGAQ